MLDVRWRTGKTLWKDGILPITYFSYSVSLFTSNVLCTRGRNRNQCCAWFLLSIYIDNLSKKCKNTRQNAVLYFIVCYGYITKHLTVISTAYVACSGNLWFWEMLIILYFIVFTFQQKSNEMHRTYNKIRQS